MDIEQLEAFLSIASTKNFTKSAQQLYVAQPTITGRIQSLEDWVGKPLFERNNRTVSLTPVGQSFLPFAEQIVSLVRESKLATQLDGQYQTQLVIGGAGSIWKNSLLPHLKAFKENHPEISVSLRTTVDDVVQSLLDGGLHIGVVYIPPRHRKITVVPYITEELVLVGKQKPGNPVTCSDLSNPNYIHLDWGDPFTEWFHDLVGQAYIPPLAVDHSGILVQLLLEGAGFGFAIKSIAAPFLESGELHQIPYQFPLNPPRRTSYVTFLSEKKDLRTTKLGLKLLTI